jgi:parallel beta-helix repeat protein/predicted outer membrane repeat protein
MLHIFKTLDTFSLTLVRIRLLAAALALAVCFGTAQTTFAATYVVTINTDGGDPLGACTANGVCSLRQAINTANGITGSDTINFAAGLSGQTITLNPALGQLAVSSNIAIDAGAVTNVSVSGGTTTRVFNIETSQIVTMTGFRITGGGGNQPGGAINNLGNLTLNNMVVQSNNVKAAGGGIYTYNPGAGNLLTINNSSILDNTASGGGNGGGIFSQGSSVTLANVTVSGNSASQEGGAIYIYNGTLNITGGSITGNSALQAYGGGIEATTNSTITIINASITNNHADGSSGFGGGILVNSSSSTITNSSISGNTATLGGGGIYFGGSGTNRITGTTLSGNSAGSGFIFNTFRGGGGLLVESATIYVSNSTVSGNSSGCECGGGGISTFNGGITKLRSVTVANNTASAGLGGGIISFISGFPAGATNVGNTIIADNTASVANNDVEGAIASQGFNLVRSRGSSSGYVASDLPDGSNPMLDILGNYGGQTQTHRLLAGSQAIDKGSNALAVDPFNNTALATDQRGLLRIFDGDGNNTATVDIGAFEAQVFTPTAAEVTVGGRVTTPKGSGVKNVQISLTGADGKTRATLSNADGYFQFAGVPAGDTYIFSASAKRFQFIQPTLARVITDDTGNVNFDAYETKRAFL